MSSSATMDRILQVVRQYWGHESLRPLQGEAIVAAIEGRDCLAVLPTGGGKSLCYQVPALISNQMTVVVSPLIALMKDQVDQLNTRGISAAFLNSSLDASDHRRVTAGIVNREYKLVFVAPERFAGENFYRLMERAGVGAFAIDEAHCISHWGHDFRGDYRQLDELKRRFPKACVHAFTATATPRVQQDIIEQLGLADPVTLVGDFFRPNLIYRVHRRSDATADVLSVIRQHQGQAGIVYCIRRADVDSLTAFLRASKIRATGYHAGMSDDERTAAQDAFAAGETDVVVATVAFGMGIDRSDIRFVVHAAMPKSIEHYQQETGRAGRDGQPADCILFYSGADYGLWKMIIEKNATVDAESSLRMLSEMYDLCTHLRCRHRHLVSYFGQKWSRASCDACDVCRGQLDVMPDSTELAQKIMSAVARMDQRFGAAYICDVLRGDPTDKVLERGHNDLSVFGLLAEADKKTLLSWIDQLVDQNLLRHDGEYRVLKLTPQGIAVLKSQAKAMLVRPAKASPKTRRSVSSKKSKAPVQKIAPPRKLTTPGGMTTADKLPSPTQGEGKPSRPRQEMPLDEATRRLYESLRAMRRELAEEENVPAFMVFSDKTLREIVRARPTSESQLLQVKGIGPAKCEAFGVRILQMVRECACEGP